MTPKIFKKINPSQEMVKVKALQVAVSSGSEMAYTA